MSYTVASLAEAIATNFVHCDRPALEAYAEMMEVKHSPKIGTETLRERMMETVGKTLDAGQAVEAAEDPKARPFEVVPPEEYSSEELNNLMQLNLTSNGVWEGRRRKITLQKPDYMKGQQAHPFTWGRSQTMVPWNTQQPVSVPYPVYNMLQSMVHKELEQERTTARDGTPKIVNHYIDVKRFQWGDYGDDPETLHLPRSQKEQFRAVAEACGYFEDWNRTALARLCRRLRVRYPRGTELEEVREMILLKLGFDLDMIGTDGGGLTVESATA